MDNPLLQRILAHKRGRPVGMYSLCSANRFVLEAAMLQAKKDHSAILIESTSNQVDQFGGYTGMTPADFVANVRAVARAADFPFERIMLGGDHLGPNAWQHETAKVAMANATDLMRAYLAAGFQKIHLDASMRCGDDPGDEHSTLPVEIAVERSTALCKTCEEVCASYTSTDRPLYVIGTEVPIPGGAKERLHDLAVTRVEDAENTIAMTKKAFLANGLTSAWERVIAVVVQPGVEFGDDTIIEYNRRNAKDLSGFIQRYDHLVYEAHSTDYQQPEALRQMVEDGFAILKVGPWLTFAFREAVFALASLEREWLPSRKSITMSAIIEMLDNAMLANPKYWRQHHRGDNAELALARRYSYSDRVRYYWSVAEVSAALSRLIANLTEHPAPMPLLSQFMPAQYRAVKAGLIANRPEELIHHKVMEITEIYSDATRSGASNLN
ncbi:MAG TPA: class II D-tagatose-bisphosphate aldolase, non-catalytic subunit [bacterium]